VMRKRLAVSGELIARCQQKEPDAERELFHETIDDVHRILYRLVGPAEDIEDLVQQVYLGVFGSIGRFEGRSAFSTWLFSICIRVARKRARGAGRFARLRDKVAAQPQKPGATPDEELARAQKAQAVHRALARLPYKQRTVLVLYEMEGFSGKEIAESLRVPEATVWTRLHHARKAFRRSFEWEKKEQRNHAPS